LNRRAAVNIMGVVGTAVLSAVILWRLMTDGGSLGHLGLGGVFIASMLSHLTIVARDMFVPLFLPLTSTHYPIVLGAAAGVGGAIGEVTTYALGWGVSESMDESGSGVEDRVAGWIGRYGLWAVLLVAMTPLPDTPIVILAGSRRLPFKRLFIAEVAGKTVLYSIGAVVGGFIFTGLENLFGGLLASLLVVAASLVFCVLVTWRPSRDLIFGWLEGLIG